MTAAEKAALEWRPATAERWAELETLFGARGACAGCWCMWWRENAAEWKARKGEGNRQALRALVEAGAVPGLLAYRAGVPVGWVSVGPREDFPRICASRALASVGGEGVWSVVCFSTFRPH